MNNGNMMEKYYFAKDFSEFEDFVKKYHYIERRYKAGDKISSQGETLKYGYYIKKGIMQLKIGNELGKEKTLSFFGNGAMFPLGVNEHHYEMEYAMSEIAFTDVVAYEFEFGEFRKMVQNSMPMAMRMLEHYCDFTSFLFYEIASQSYHSTLMRVANILYICRYDFCKK